jgi:hypothetical protein
MADYGVISDVSTSLAMMLGQGPRRPPMNERTQLDDLSRAARVGLTPTMTLHEFLEDMPSRNRPRPQQSAGTVVVSFKPPIASRPGGAEAEPGHAFAGEAMLAVIDQAPNDPGAHFRVAVRQVVGLWTSCALRSLATEDSHHADEGPASLVQFASKGPVISTPDHTDGYVRRTR